ncbi:Oidioi.mRNA.OKI2018_I69.XSR.g13849.t2.cds [Oikopleura dioica]|uniref:Oidioi.mRNA.OKI2018_I69.XSR.g13849.t2.cds n=1 Tax=Oikopleura dioica TaxID=34765 RepID=A0ABN7SE89_OIKDI|nr:Oidioi.mRNA.OKI2018_I69.XSR.g13849.t2.cds [Oikopleura dioica]
MGMRRRETIGTSAPSTENVKRNRHPAELVFRELITTEETYVQRLNAYREVRQRLEQRLRHLKSDVKRQVEQALDPPGLEAIMRLHRDEILPQLKRRYNMNGELCFGDIFSSKFIAPFFKIYAEFLSQKELIDMEIHKLRKNTLIGPHVNSIEQRDIPELLNGLKIGLNVLLLEPVQRIPRYELLLRDYIKRLDKDHVDLPAAIEAEKLVQEANVSNNKKKAMAEKRGYLAKLAKDISGLGPLVDGRRNLIYHESTYKLKQKSYTPKRADILILNDVVVICAERNISKGMEVKAKLPLETLYVEKLDMPVQVGKNSNDYRNVKGLRLSSIKETVDLVECPLKDHSGHLSSTRSSVEKIYSILISVIRELQESLLTLKRGDDHPVLELPENDDEPVKFPPIRLGSRAPRLMRESDVSACMMCTRGNRSRGFSSGSSLIHCRICGRLVCSSCLVTGHAPLQVDFLDVKDSKDLHVCKLCIRNSEDNSVDSHFSHYPMHFDDYWRQISGSAQGYLKVLIPEKGIFGSDDTENLFEADLNSSFTFDRLVADNQRQWLLSNGHLRIRLLLEEDHLRDDWVTAFRFAIQMAGDAFPGKTAPSQHALPHDRILLRDGTKSLDRSREARSNREKRVRSLQPTDLYKYTKDQISGPLSAFFQSSNTSSQLHQAPPRASRISRSHSLRSSTKTDLISDPMSIPDHFVHGSPHSSPVKAHLSHLNPSLSHKVSTGSLDDIYLCKKTEQAAPDSFKRNEKERFSARFKLGSRLKNLVRTNK